MATTVTHIVDPDGGAGHDYDSLVLWEAGEQGDLTGVRDEIAVATCRCTGGTAETSGQTTLAGWTVSATQYIKVWTDPAESYRPTGVGWPTGNKYRIEVNGGTNTGFNISQNYTRVEGIWTSQNDAEVSGFTLGDTLAGGCRLVNCVARNTSANSNASGFTHGGVNEVAPNYVINCLAYGPWEWGFYVRGNNTTSRSFTYNCTAYGCYYGFRARSSYCQVKNCIAVGCTDAFLESTAYEVADYNGYDEGADPGTNGIDLSGYTDAQIFVDAAGGDFHLAASSPCIGVGLNLYNDASFAFQDDIDGNDRGGAAASWDIGADEYVAAGGTTLTINVTDSVTGAEVTTGVGGTLVASTSDTFSVSESTTGVTGSLVCSTSDSLSISEVTTGLTGSLVGTTSDSVSISELTTAVTGSIILTVTDSLTVSDLDLVSCKVGSPVVSITDSVTASGIITIQLSIGSICWGQSTGVSELVKRTFSTWTGTGSVGGSGDEEVLEIHTGEYMQSAAYELGLGSYAITVNKYRAGGTPIISYKTASTSAGIAGASLLSFSGSFSSLGWIQVRLEATGDINVEDVEVNLITLAPSVSDNVGVSGEVSCTVAAAAEGPTLVVNTSDSFSITEQVSSLTSSCIVSVSDSLTVSEISILSMIREVSIIDTLLVSEEVGLLITALFVSVNDSLTVSEQVSSIVSSLVLTTSDSVEVTDVVSIKEDDLVVVVSESVGLSEEVVISCPLAGVETSETVLVQELVGCGLGDLELSVEESSSLSESTISEVSAPVINVSDNIEVTDVASVGVEGVIATPQIDVQDSVSVEESIGAQVSDLPSSSFDTVTLDEQASVEIRLQVEAVEDITVSEVVQTTTSALEISVDDSSLVGEVVSGVTGGLVINTDDSVGVGEVVSTGSALADLDVTVDSSAEVIDSSDVVFAFEISVTEQVVISESVSCWTGDLSLTVSDGVVLSESVNIYWSIASGLLILDCDILVPLLDCELLYPEINVYMQLPTIDLEVT
jgi:hypothetical protein